MSVIAEIVKSLIYILKNSTANHVINFGTDNLHELLVQPIETENIYSNNTLYLSGMGCVLKIINGTQRRQEFKMDLRDDELRVANRVRYNKIMVKRSYEDDDVKLTVEKIDSDAFKEQLFMAAMTYNQSTYNMLELGYELLDLLEQSYEITVSGELFLKSTEELKKVSDFLQNHITENLGAK